VRGDHAAERLGVGRVDDAEAAPAREPAVRVDGRTVAVVPLPLGGDQRLDEIRLDRCRGVAVTRKRIWNLQSVDETNDWRMRRVGRRRLGAGTEPRTSLY
jgi:hypothetical protein